MLAVDEQQLIVQFLDDLVVNNDILSVRVSHQNLADGLKNTPGKCPGALAIAAALGRPEMNGIKITVGHKTKASLGDRVVVKVVEEPTRKWTAWIVNSPGKSGFHPQRFDQGKQKTPGAMMLERWSEETIEPMKETRKAELHTPEARRARQELVRASSHNGVFRIYNG